MRTSQRPGISLFAALGWTLVALFAAAFWWFAALVIRKIIWNYEEGRARMPRHSLQLVTIGVLTFALLLEVALAHKVVLVRLAGAFYALEFAAMLMLFWIDDLLQTPVAKRGQKVRHLIGEILLHGFWWLEALFRLGDYGCRRTDTKVRQILYLLPFFILQIALADFLLTLALAVNAPIWVKCGCLVAGYVFGIMLSRQLEDETQAAWAELELTPAELKVA